MDRDEAMQVLRATAPATDAEVSGRVGRRTLDVLREGITMTSTSEAPDTVPPTRRRRRLTRGLVAGLAGLVLAGGGAAAWAAYQGLHESTSIDCTSPGVDTIIPPVSGDPVADCTAMWRSQGVTVPAGLRAYDSGRAIVVRLDGTVPDGKPVLPAGSVQDKRVIELSASMEDIVDRPSHLTCAQEADEQARAQAELDRLKLTDWTVKAWRDAPPKAGNCVHAVVDSDQRAILLVDSGSGDPVVPDPGTARLAGLLRTHISQGCLSLDEAEAVARKDIRTVEPDLPAEALAVTRTVDPTAPCTRVDWVPAGNFDLRLYGPQTATR
ncbi:hypothetical protein [Oryzihumus leptocrescens]|uniref:Uncharacterized protein n=1 Tax=Oryzihumus leptocrescens TaxID=297536 RepID=A0A542ZGS2_9MICO|nr:hypothetical protein [Oryzihumus leptocrescens]TQL59526.1 hypothetical protein FB474_0881 [Oryzihumus leptocrescens]